MSSNVKPLGRKAYGSIGHIHGSRLGPGDHHVHEGQSLMCTTKAPKDKTVWVQTKLDGSCVAVYRQGDELVPLIRAGYRARDSKREMHHVFADWVDANADRFLAVLEPAERLVGEWLAVAHGTRYTLNQGGLVHLDPFVAFDIMIDDRRAGVDEFYTRVPEAFAVPDVRSGPMAPEAAMARLDTHGADQPEGVVYRVESAKGVDFLAKWVRPDKVDGSLLDQDIWNWRP